MAGAAVGDAAGAVDCAASFGADAADGSSKWRRAVRARNRRGADGVDGELEQVGDFGVAELLEFAEEEDFAVDAIELFDGAADPEAGFGGVQLGRIGNGPGWPKEVARKAALRRWARRILKAIA